MADGNETKQNNEKENSYKWNICDNNIKEKCPFASHFTHYSSKTEWSSNLFGADFVYFLMCWIVADRICLLSTEIRDGWP